MLVPRKVRLTSENLPKTVYIPENHLPHGFGKRTRGAPTINAAVPQRKIHGDLLYSVDPDTKRKWLVDGGAFVSLLPPSPEKRRRGPNATKLQAANGTPIDCYGTTNLNVRIGKKVYNYDFVIADVKKSILGADFLAAHNLAPNHRDGTIIDLDDFTVINVGVDDHNEAQGVNFVDELNNPYYKLLDKFPDISKPSFKTKEVKHGVRHHIPTTGHPVQSKARPLSPEKLKVAKAQMDLYVKLGIAKRAKSEWTSPMVVATKPGGGWRVCGDYRRLNCVTTDDKYPVRSLSDFNAELAGKTVFSKIDLLKGYHQIPVADEDVRKTGVITPFGLYIFPRTPFGLKNAGQDFQRLMDEIFEDIPHTFVYIDDILVASIGPVEHEEDLERVFSALNDNGLVLNRAKCVLGKPQLEFLGYFVNKDGVKPVPERVKAIRETIAPVSVTELRRFIGMVNYYRRFIPRAAHHLFHLFGALKGKPKKLAWTPDCQAAFQSVKNALSNATMLHHPRLGATLSLTSDASKTSTGAVLEQRGPKGFEPLAYYSSKLSTEKPDQTVWPPFDRELLGVFRAVRHFRHMIEGKAFTIYTDQQALIPALHKKSEPLTARQQYQLSCIAEFSTDIRYLEGKANVVADALSRPNGADASVNAIQEPHLFCQLMEIHNISPSRAISFVQWQNEPRSPPVRLNRHITRIPTATSQSLGKPFNPVSHIDQPLDANKDRDLGDIIASIDRIGIDLSEMARDQPLDQDFQRISVDARSGLNFRRVDTGNAELLVDIGSGEPRPFVPLSWRRKVFDALHSLGHPGTHRTAQIVSSKFIWPNIRADCTRWARECVPCQRSKVTRHTTPPIGEFEVPTKRFSHLNVDIVTMPTSNGYSHLLTIVDRFTRWPAAIPIPDMTVESVIDALNQGWIAQFGIPATITTDRGGQFISATWDQLMKTWGIRSLRTTAYHPEANGLVERFHRRLKESLLAICGENPNKWYWRLPASLLAIRTTLKQDIGSSPADLVYGEGLCIPGDLMDATLPSDDTIRRRRTSTLASLRLEVARMQPTPTSAHRQPSIHIPPELANASHVFIRRGAAPTCMSAPYDGPYRVVDKIPAGYRIAMPGGKTETVALARLKPAHIDTEDAQEEEIHFEENQPPSPRQPGRPPGVRTRIPETTNRVTRQTPRQRGQLDSSQPSTSTDTTTQSQPDPPAAAPAPRRRRRRDRVIIPQPPEVDNRNSQQHQPPASPTPPTAPCPSASQSTEPSQQLPQTTSEPYRSEQLFHNEDEPGNQPSFFEFEIPTASQPAPPEAPPTATASTAPTYAAVASGQPTRPRVLSFSSRRPAGDTRRYFSDQPRRRPDVSVILDYLGIPSQSSTTLRATPPLQAQPANRLGGVWAVDGHIASGMPRQTSLQHLDSLTHDLSR